VNRTRNAIKQQTKHVYVADVQWCLKHRRLITCRHSQLLLSLHCVHHWCDDHSLGAPLIQRRLLDYCLVMRLVDRRKPLPSLAATGISRDVPIFWIVKRLNDNNITKIAFKMQILLHLGYAQITVLLIVLHYRLTFTHSRIVCQFTGLPSPYRQSRVLGSYTSDLLSTQSSSTNIAARRFSCCVPTVWNSLPSFVRTADSFTSFRSQFKTYMFARHLQPVRSPRSASDMIPLPVTRSFARYKFVKFTHSRNEYTDTRKMYPFEEALSISCISSKA